MKTRDFFFSGQSVKILFLILAILIIQYQPVSSQETISEMTTGNVKSEYSKDVPDNPVPPGWDTYTIQGDPHGIIVMMAANPRIGNIPISPGDYIGAFYEDDNGDLKCGGQEIWVGDDNIMLTVFRNDPDTPEKDGFSSGEQMHFKFYSYTTLKEYDVDLLSFDITTYPGTDLWYPLIISQVINMASTCDFDAYAIATPNPVCIGNSVSLEALIFIGTSGDYTYSWTSDPEGFISSLQNPTVTPDVNTTYLLEVSDGILVSDAYANVIVNNTATLEAGSDGTTCENEPLQVSAIATNFGGILWTSSGDGSFCNPEILNPVYSPGPADAENGSAILTVQALPLDDCSFAPSDELTLSIGRNATVILPTTIDFCPTQEIWITADAQEYSSISWTTSGDGTFSASNEMTTQYFPGNFDQNLGEFTLTCCVESSIPCSGSNCAEMFCTLTGESATVNAPTSRTKCENLPVPVFSVAFNYTSSLWETQGDGYFENPDALSTNYIPGPLDITNGGTIVTINAFGSGACLNHPTTKDVNVIIIREPNVDAGDVDVVCGGLPIQLTGSVEDYLSFEWSSTGDGYFDSISIFTPIYYPGSNDIASGEVDITLTAHAISPCVGCVSDVLEIEIVDQAQVGINNPTNQNVCIGNDLQLEAWASGYIDILWETTGDGDFDDPTILNPIYFHGPVIDLNGNPITLKVTAFAPPACGSNVSDQISVSYFVGASSNAGENFTACADDLFVSGSAENYVSISWQTNGDGYFVEPGSLTTQYIPGSDDLAAGTAQLCLVAHGFGDCPDVGDSLAVGILANPVANIGVDEAIVCYDENYSFDQADILYASSINWFTTNGGGSFNDSASPNPIYMPDPETDYALGCIQIGVTAQPVSPCLIAAEDSMELCFETPPEVSAGPDATLIEAETYNTDATATNYSTVSWSTSGDGTFDIPSVLATEYNPGQQDIQNESVQLTLTTYPLSACPEPASSVLTLTIMRQQNITLQSGWNGFSSFVNPPDPAFDEVVSPISSQLEFAQNMTEIYWPEYGINTIGDFNNSVGYRVKLNANASLPITGFAETDKTISIPQGWSTLPVISDCAVPYTELISQLSDKLIAVTEIGGTGMLYPEQGIFNLSELEPGKAYSIKMSENADFTFPDCSK